MQESAVELFFVSVTRHLKSDQMCERSSNRFWCVCFGRSLFVSLRFDHVFTTFIWSSRVFVVNGRLSLAVNKRASYIILLSSNAEYQSARLSTIYIDIDIDSKEWVTEKTLIFSEKQKNKWNLISYSHFNLKLLNSSHPNMNRMDMQHPMNSIIMNKYRCNITTFNERHRAGV